MKRIGYIVTEQTVTFPVCRTAIMEAAQGKHKRRAVQQILFHLDEYAAILRDMTLRGTYQPSPYKECHIIDRPSKKHRILEKPRFFPDQCMHHLVIDLVRGKFLHALDPYCIGGIKGRGPHFGHVMIRRWMKHDRKGTRYCLKGDVKKCYDSIRPAVIVRVVEHLIKDKRYLALVKTIAYSHHSLPLGNYTSGWFVNLILTILDRYVRSTGVACHYLRYVDDFIVLGPNKRKLHRLVPKIQAVLASIGLELKGNWQVFPAHVRGIDIIGFRFFGTHTLYRKRNILSLLRSIRAYLKKPSLEHTRGLLSRAGQTKYWNSYNFRRKYIFPLKEMA